MKAYSPEDNYKLKKILMAAKVYGKDIQVDRVSFDPKVSKNFLQAYPQYSLPLLQTPEGKFIFGINSILIYIAGENNIQDRIVKAKMIQELQILQRNVEAATGVLLLKGKGCQDVNESQVEKAKQTVSKYMKELNDRLALKTFLAGDRLTPADISSYQNLRAVQELFEKDIQGFKNVGRWMKHLSSIDAF